MDRLIHELGGLFTWTRQAIFSDPTLPNTIWLDWCIFGAAWLVVLISLIFIVRRVPIRWSRRIGVAVLVLFVVWGIYDRTAAYVVEHNYESVSHAPFQNAYSRSTLFWMGNVAGQCRTICLPGFLLTLVAAPWIYVQLRNRRRLEQNHCLACDYDLSATPSISVCPECGRATRPASSPTPVYGLTLHRT